MTGKLENGNGKWKYSDKTWTMTSEFGLYKASYISDIHTNKLLGLIGDEVVLEDHNQASDNNYWFITRIDKDGWFKIMPTLSRSSFLTVKDLQSLTIEGNTFRIHLYSCKVIGYEFITVCHFLYS